MIDLLWPLMNIYHAINPSKSRRISYIPWNAIFRNNTIETTKQAPVRSESEMRDCISSKIQFESTLTSVTLEFLEDLTYSLWLVRFVVRELRHKLCCVWGHNIADSSIHIFINTVSSESLKLCLRLFFEPSLETLQTAGAGKLRSAWGSTRLFLEEWERHIATWLPAVEKLTRLPL